MALDVAGSGAPAEDWNVMISELLFDIGWRTSRDSYSPPIANGPTLSVLEILAGSTRAGWRITGVDLAVAATGRRVIRSR